MLTDRTPSVDPLGRGFSLVVLFPNASGPFTSWNGKRGQYRVKHAETPISAALARQTGKRRLLQNPRRQRVSAGLRHCRDDLQKWSFGHSRLTSDEAPRIAAAIARLPGLLIQRRGFYPRGGGHERWKASRPYHVALEDSTFGRIGMRSTRYAS